MKKFTFKLLVVFALIANIIPATAQVGVGTTLPEGALDLNPTIATNFGFNTPRIALTALNAQAPVVNPQGGAIPAGTVIYNTATANTGVAAPPNSIGPGLYFWNGVKWVAFAGSPGGLDWSLLGNGSTNIATDFLGTTDAVDMAVRTSNLERMRVLSNGHVLVNTTANTQLDNLFEVVSTTAGDDAITGSAVGNLGRGVQGNSTLDGQGVAGFNTGIGNGVIGVNSDVASLSGSAVTGLLQSTSAIKTAGLTFAGVSGQSSSIVGVGVSGANFGSGIGVYGQTTGGTSTASNAAVYGTLSQTVAGNQDVAGVIGTQSNTRQGTGGYSGPTAALVNSALAGVSGSLASRESTNNIDSYFFGVIGQLLVDTSVGGALIPRRSGGVLGENSGAWGSLGYRDKATNTLFGVYSSTAMSNGTGAGKMATPISNNNVGMGINGGFMGGYVQGSQYGLISKGKEFGMYVNGNTVTNAPIVQLTEGNNKRIATYSSTSTSVDVTTRGKSKLVNGEIFVAFNEAFTNSISTSELSKDVDSAESINITVTPVGDCNGVFVKRITSTGFYIKENNKGKSNVTFNWTAVGTQKGYENGIKISDLILSNDFDTKMNGVMTPDTEDNTTVGTPIYFDGSKIRFEDAPADLNKPKASVIEPRVNPIVIPVDKPKDLEKK